MEQANKSFPVRFIAQGKLFTISFDALMNYPDTYLAWLARSQPEALERGIPIEINKRPEAVRRLLESYSDGSSGSSSVGNNAEQSLVFEDFQNRQSAEGPMNRLPNQPPPPPPPPPPPERSEYDLVIKDAVRDVLHVLTQFRKWGHLHDKAIFLLRWGRSSNSGRVLRPHTVKMYESLTGKLYDVRNSSDFHGSRSLEPSSSGFSSVMSAETATYISSTVQEMIVLRIREAGYSCNFVDVGVNHDGILQWKNQGNRESSNGTVRCLVVNTR